MIITVGTTPQRYARVFQKPTRIEIQVKSADTIRIARGQGELSAPAPSPEDGLAFNNANTLAPWGTWIQGELWYVSNNPNGGQFILEVMTDYGC